MTDKKPTDYAAIIRAANQTVPNLPEWLSAGKYLYSPEYGVGEVMAVLGRRLIVKFVEEVKPTQFGDWEEAIALTIGGMSFSIPIYPLVISPRGRSHHRHPVIRMHNRLFNT